MSFSSDIPLQANQLPISLDFPNPSSPEFLAILSLFSKRVSDSVNTKEGSLYLLQELANFQRYFTYDSGTTTPNPNSFRNGYRTTYDLVVLNGNIPIPAGFTSIAADPIINGILNPVHGFGAATIAGPQYIFLPSIDVNVRFNNTVPAAQTIDITNNTGTPLTQAYFVIEYLKN